MKLNSQNLPCFTEIVKLTKFPNILWGVLVDCLEINTIGNNNFCDGTVGNAANHPKSYRSLRPSHSCRKKLKPWAQSKIDPDICHIPHPLVKIW